MARKLYREVDHDLYFYLVDSVSDFDMVYKEFQPPPALSGFVKAFWILEGDGPAGEDKVYRLLPYGCPSANPVRSLRVD
jgi:hypothetical protein